MSEYNFLYITILIILIFFLSNDIYLNKFINNTTHTINQYILILVLIYFVYNNYNILYILLLCIIYLIIEFKKNNIINIESFNNMNDQITEPFKNNVNYVRNIFNKIKMEYFD
jgi:hypothetical protein